MAYVKSDFIKKSGKHDPVSHSEPLESVHAARQAEKSLIDDLNKAREALKSETDEKRRKKLESIIRSLELMKTVRESRH